MDQLAATPEYERLRTTLLERGAFQGALYPTQESWSGGAALLGFVPDDERRGGIGGASGDAGVEYRRAVAAYAVAHGLTSVPLQGFGVAAPFAQVSAVSLETDDPVDDVRIEFIGGAISYVQAKRALHKGKPLNAAVEQWVRAARRGLEPGRDHLIIVTGSVSGPLGVLQGTLRRLKTDRQRSPARRRPNWTTSGVSWVPWTRVSRN